MAGSESEGVLSPYGLMESKDPIQRTPQQVFAASKDGGGEPRAPRYLSGY